MNRGYIFIFLATVFFSSMEVALKTVAHDVNPRQLNCTRFLVGGCCSSPLPCAACASTGHGSPQPHGKALPGSASWAWW